MNSIGYNAALLPSALDFANGVNLSISADQRNRPDIISSASKLTLDYRYNARGLIDKITTSQNNSPLSSRDVEYDSRGRLTLFDSDTGTLDYQFDVFGNLTEKAGPLTAGPYTYTGNKIDSIPYSASGNQLSANGRTLIYNEENRLKQVTGSGINTSYVYDGKGNRVKSTDALTGNSKLFVYDEGGSLLSELSQVGSGSLFYENEYINGPTGTLVTASYEEVPRGFSVFDVQGAVRAVWDNVANCRTGGYNVYRSSSSGGPYQKLNTSGPVTNGTFDDTSVADCATYYYIIRMVYTDGVEGASSQEISHQFVPLEAVLSVSPSHGLSPVTETFTFSAAGMCGTTTATNFHLEYGDAVSKDFGGASSVQHTYSNTSSCYPYCTATLTVTFSNGVNSTQSVLVNMSPDLLQDENFTDGIADGFEPLAGTWSVGSAAYTGQSPASAWGVSRSGTSCNNCVIWVFANSIEQAGDKNAFVVFDLVDTNNFKFAGFDVVAKKWSIGQVASGIQSTLKFANDNTLQTGTYQSVEVVLEAAGGIVSLKGNGITRCMHSFGALSVLPVGLGVRNGQSVFDNFKIAPPLQKNYLHNENFDDGVANGYSAQQGSWSVVTGKYRGVNTQGTALSLTPQSGFTTGVIEADLLVTSKPT